MMDFAPREPAHSLASEATGEVRAIPPRYWWLKRIGLAVGLLLVALTGLRWYWGVIADRRWRATLAALEATGEPIYASDFVESAVPDEENAAYYLCAAAAALRHSADGVSSIAAAEAMASVGRFDEGVALVAANRESLDLVRRARATTRVNWGVDFSQGVVSARPKANVFEVTDVVKLVNVSARVSLHNGDQRQAFECVLDMLHAAWAARQYCSLLGPLAGVVAVGHAIDVIDRMAPELDIGDAPTTVTRAEIEELIQRLFDETDQSERWRAGWRFVRAEQLELVRGVAEARTPLSTFVRAPGAWLLAPAFKLDAARAVEAANKIVQVGEATNAVAAREAMPAAPDFSNKLVKYSRLVSAFVTPSYASVPVEYFAHMARGRLAAVRLALRLYELDHGALPATLEPLVPAYLPAVPGDPLFGDGRAVRYVPAGPDAGLFAGPTQAGEPVFLRLNPKQTGP